MNKNSRTVPVIAGVPLTPTVEARRKQILAERDQAELEQIAAELANYRREDKFERYGLAPA